MWQGLERLGVHWPSLLAYLINFVVLLALLTLVAYRPFMRAMRERAERSRESQALLEDTRRLTAQTAADARAAATATLDAAQAQADSLLRRTLEEARSAAQALAEAARSQAAAEHAGARRTLLAEEAALMLLAIERLLHRTLDRQEHARLIAEATRALAEARLEGVPPGGVAKVTTSVALAPGELDAVLAALPRAAGVPVHVVVHTDPAVAGGMAVAVGDAVWDHTLRGRLQRLGHKLTEAAP